MSHRFLARCAAVALFTCAGAPALAAPEAAKSADAFVESIGVNTHYGNAIFGSGNAYGNRAVDAKLAALGVRHIRDHSYNDTGVGIVQNLYDTDGIRANLILGETSRSPADLVTLLKNHSAYEAIEGLNEPDFTTRSYTNAGGTTFNDVPGSNDFSATRAFQNDLYAAVKGDAQTNHVTVLSPAMGRANKSNFLSPINFDVAALHSYPWASPATTAPEPSFGMDTAITNIATLRGSKPLWATESGYYNAPLSNNRSVPENISAKYTPRLYAEFFNRGAARTYLYELADQGPDTTMREQNFGLLRFDLSEKPAYTAMKNLIDLVEEPGAANFAAGSLDYTLSSAGDTSKLHHTLLEKSNGTFYLMLWQEVLSYDSVAKTNIVTPDLAVTLSLSGAFNAKTYLPGSSIDPTATQSGMTSMNLAVPDQVLLVELAPVPEPGSIAALGTIAFAWGLTSRRRR